MSRITFGVIGGGWRTDFFMRIAQALPERFAVCGVMLRNEDKAKAFAEKWHVPTYMKLDSLLAHRPDFVVVSVSWDASPLFILELVKRGIPVLGETPPAPDVDGLRNLWHAVGPHGKVQIAEQYPYQPLHAARLSVVESGRLGDISQAQVSAAHGYHGVGLIRKFLGASFEQVRISAFRFESPLTEGPDRGGPLQTERVRTSRQTIAHMWFGDKLGVFDFSDDQYFSWIRSPRLLVRGTRGELNGEHARWLLDFKTPMNASFRRENAGEQGNLEGYYLKGYLLGSEWIYTNPFQPARFADDEIAIAVCLEKMAEYANGGPSFYGLADAAHDHYLSLMIERAVQTGEPVLTEMQPWAQ